MHTLSDIDQENLSLRRLFQDIDHILSVAGNVARTIGLDYCPPRRGLKEGLHRLSGYGREDPEKTNISV